MTEFLENVALVTGASRGIGKYVAQDLCRRGAGVILAARSGDQIEAIAERLRQQGGEAQALGLDISDPGQIQPFVRQVAKSFGRVDILVNNAGVTRDRLLLRMKEGDWRDVLATNLDGPYRLTRKVLPLMLRQRYGRIVNVVSVVAQTGNAGQANYVASKAGLIGLTKSLAREVASRGITVNAIAPGLVETAMTAGLTEEAREKLLAQIPVGRTGSVEDIAFGVRFLASREAGYITGHVLSINGGMYM